MFDNDSKNFLPRFGEGAFAQRLVEEGIRTRDEMQLLTQPVDLRRRWDMQENVPDMRKNHRVLRIDHAMRETLTRRKCVSVSTKGPFKIKFLPSPSNCMNSPHVCGEKENASEKKENVPLAFAFFFIQMQINTTVLTGSSGN